MALKRNVRGGVPSPYPRFLFHGLRSMQLLSSIVVGGIMSYFIYYMRRSPALVALQNPILTILCNRTRVNIHPMDLYNCWLLTPHTAPPLTHNQQLFAVSLFTILSLTVTICLYNFTYLSPRFNLILNGTLSLIWAVGFGLICWSVSTSHILGKYCVAAVWRGENTSGEAEAAICRDYKALWAMALVGTCVESHSCSGCVEANG